MFVFVLLFCFASAETHSFLTLLFFSPSNSSCVSVPSDFGGLSVDAYVSGIVAGILDGAGFHARVTAHSVALEEGESMPSQANMSTYKREKAVFLVKFDASVLERDASVF